MPEHLLAVESDDGSSSSSDIEHDHFSVSEVFSLNFSHIFFLAAARFSFHVLANSESHVLPA
jgi:hypothetical protein